MLHSGPFGGVSWRLGFDGLAVGNDVPHGTSGPPQSALNVWNWFGAEIIAAATAHDVPVELIVAMILTESAGGKHERSVVATARREEPGYVSDEATPGRVSVGCCQTLLSTASFILHRRVTAAELEDPAVSIDAGAAYLASAYDITLYDAPLAAAAYNAGSVEHDATSANRWRLVCYPLGTGEYIDKFIAWLNDAMRLSTAVDRAGDAPSFATELARIQQQGDIA